MKPNLYLGALMLAATPAAAQMAVSLSPSLTSPAPLGTRVTWTAAVSGASPGTLWYRFRTRYAGIRLRRHPLDFGFRTVVDYGPNPSLTWSTIAREGPYQIEVSVANNSTGETASVVASFVLTRLAGQTPVLTPTSHPLVFVYSAPPCRGSMRVQFTSPEGVAQNTPFQPCDSPFSMNFYLAGIRPNTRYTVQHELVDDASDVLGPQMSLTTSSLPIQPPLILVTTPPPQPGGILLHSIITSNAIATDLSGNVIWYVPFLLSVLTRAAPGGVFLGIIDDGTKDPSYQIFREFDLTGATLAETNAARVSQQLIAMGIHPVTCFHHEAIHLPNGQYLILAGSERILSDVQGPGQADVLGDTILVLDPNLQVVWAWDAFDHLDPHRAAILGEKCTYPATLACSTFYQASAANDWLHGNGLQLTPDGNILYSIRHQDWIAKIDYRNGAGTGNILWRMGVGGDFQIASTDPYPWFSHQHDPNFLADGKTLLVFDNGNTRISKNPSEHSRAQILQVDEQNRLATLTLNTDLGVSSSALGTAELLPNGDSHYDAGFFPNPDAPGNLITQLFELDPTGAIVWTLRVYAQEYRNFHMNDLYTPPVEWVP